MSSSRGNTIVPQQTLREFLQEQLPQASGVKRLVVGLSGGLDSSVLLHALHAVAPEFALPLRAVHVHHGLSPNADAWAAAVEKLCATLRVPLEVRRVRVAEGASREAEARAARYAAFAASLADDEALLLAQHCDDQAETFLFRLLRGAGVTGLGAMRRSRTLPGRSLPQWRPFLPLPRKALLAYAQAHALNWTDDESNQDTRYDRNYLRLEILPRLEARWPAVRETLAATALRLQEADELLQELAAGLAALAIDAEQRLSIPALQQLAPPRQKLLLRYWLQRQGFVVPNAAVLNLILGQVVTARDDAMPELRWTGCELRRYRDRLYALPPLTVIPKGWERYWDGAAPLLLPDGQLLLQEGNASASASWRVRYRRGGERLRLAPDGPSRELKTLLQETGVPPWQRERLPLVFAGEELVAVAGIDALSADPRCRFLLRAGP